MFSDFITNLLASSGIEFDSEGGAHSKGSYEKINQAWFEAGQAYGQEIRLLNMQLRAKSQEKIVKLFENLTDAINTSDATTSDILLMNLVKVQVLKKVDGRLNWAPINSALNNLSLTKKEIYGAALGMAQEQNMEGLINCIKRLLCNNYDLSADLKLKVITSSLASYLEVMPSVSSDSSPNEWDKYLEIHLAIINLMKVASEPIDDADKESVDVYFNAIIKKLELIKSLSLNVPDDLCGKAWNILMGIQNQNTVSSLSRVHLIESKSLPRSGHHFLKNLLQSQLKNKFSYCEGYAEPGCCKTSPCINDAYWNYSKKNNVSHLRLIKSHDFDLEDKTFDPLPGVYRFIQVREPIEILVSWLELQQLFINKDLLHRNNVSINRIMLYHEPELIDASWELIDASGTVHSNSEAEEWLSLKSKYMISFLNKWLPLSYPLNTTKLSDSGNYILNYTDLTDHSRIFDLLGIEVSDEHNLPIFRPKHKSIFSRRSSKITSLVKKNSAILGKLSNDICANLPRLADGSRLYF